MSRSVNMAIIIGNLTRDPEMRYTPNGQAVTTFSVATNRKWAADGVEKEEVEFHNVVAWKKLAELCSQLLSKGRKAYIQGRLQTRNWVDAQGLKHYKTEIVAEDMLVLDGKRETHEVGEGAVSVKPNDGKMTSPSEAAVNVSEVAEETVNEEEIPF